MTDYSLFTGCLIAFRYPQFEIAARKVFGKLGVSLSNPPFTCCPNQVYMEPASIETARKIGERNIGVSKDPILVLCNGCYSSLASSADLQGQGEKVVHYLEKLPGWLEGREIEKIIESVNVSTFLGCHATTPDHPIDRRYDPAILDDLSRTLGADVQDYNGKSDCCMPGAILFDREAIDASARKRFDAVADTGSDLLVISCPTCYSAFELAYTSSKEDRFSIIHILQLIAMAMDLSPEELQMRRNRAINKDLLEALK